MRTLVDIPDEQIEILDEFAEANGLSRAESIRRAIALFLRHNVGSKKSAFGLLKGREVDGLKLQKKLRVDR